MANDSGSLCRQQRQPDVSSARFGQGEDILKPYHEPLDRWLWPDVDPS